MSNKQKKYLEQIHKLINLYNKGDYLDAESIGRAITRSFPKEGLGWKCLGAVLKSQGRTEDSLEAMQKAAKLLPFDAEAQNNLGITYKDLGQIKEAESCYRRALKIDPFLAEALNNLGVIFKEMGLLFEAESCYRQALEIKPNIADIHNNLGAVFFEKGLLTEAEACHHRALEIDPFFAKAHYNMGNTLNGLGRLEEAEIYFRRAIKIKADYAEAYCNLGVVLKDIGRLEEAENYCRRGLEIKPDFAEAISILLYIMIFSDRHQPITRLEEALKYGEIITSRAGTHYLEWNCSQSPERLRVGFVSGDFNDHPVGHFMESVLSQIGSSLDLVAYQTDSKSDELTTRIKPYFSKWQSLMGSSDETAAQMIHDDGIHVLLDLSGHTSKGRLPMFARKPAPVQAAWLGFLATCGVKEIDYIIGDPYVTPSEDECNYSEKVWRLPESYCCFTPPNVAVNAGPLPALSAGYVTFGSFNNLSKITDTVVALWARIIKAVAGSRLFLKTRQLDEHTIRKTTEKRFAEHGISPEQLIMEGFSPRKELLAAYQRVDIALDPFPCNGVTTSVESLWMAVPIIAMTGNSFISRCGQSIVGNAGLNDWIAENEEDYYAKAIMHSSNLEKLAILRSGLRQQVLASPIFDSTRFAKNFENALWEMWNKTEVG